MTRANEASQAMCLKKTFCFELLKLVYFGFTVVM